MQCECAVVEGGIRLQSRLSSDADDLYEKNNNEKEEWKNIYGGGGGADNNNKRFISLKLTKTFISEKNGGETFF